MFRKFRKHLFLSMTALMLLVTPVRADGVDLYKHGLLEELTGTLDQEVPLLLEKHGVPGASVALIEAGKIAWSQGYGYANTSEDRPMTADTVLQAASISKAVTAWGVMKLVDQGKISLDAPVDTYLKRWHLPPSAFDHQKVTIRNVLNHTAGLSVPSYPGYDPENSPPTLLQSLSGQGSAGTLAVIQAPGTKFLYSGGGYSLLQLMIEDVTGRSFSEYMQQEVLLPLGMKNSSFEPSPELTARLATPYGPFGGAYPVFRFSELAAAGLHTTAQDLALFAAASTGQGGLAGGGVLQEQTLREMTNIPGGYGLGYMVAPMAPGFKMQYHTGMNKGWTGVFAVIDATGDGIVVLTNSDRGPDVYQDIMQKLWLKWETGAIPAAYAGIEQMRFNVQAAAAGLALLFLLYLWLLIRGIRTGKRLWAFGGGRRVRFGRWLLIAVPVLLGLVWWIGIYSPWVVPGGWLVRSILPAGTESLTFVWTLWCLTTVVGAMYPRVRKKR